MLFRNPVVVRSIAGFFLLEFATSLFAPRVSWALMGPSQPEFTSYEAAASPDMVNLSTGDFTYNIPVLEVPGPERSFSLPLTYRAGIRLEQEASWVGLGWSLNAGAIARSINGYPDDAGGDVKRNTYQQEITRGWQGGLPGILELGWDVNTGHSGSASLFGIIGLGWSNGGVSSGEVLGIKTDGSQTPAEMGIGLVSAELSIYSFGAAGGVKALAISAAKQLGEDIAIGVVSSEVLGKASSSGASYGQPTLKTEKGFLHTNYWQFFNEDKREYMYGSLNFGGMRKSAPGIGVQPHRVDGAGGPWAQTFSVDFYNGPDGNLELHTGADLSQYAEPSESYYASSTRPLSISHDDFSVMGGQVSGSIRPYRLEVGSLAYPRRMSEHHDKFADVPYLDDYKVPFRYENSISNSYDFHEFTPDGATTWDPTGIEASYAASAGGVLLRDPKLNAKATRTATARKGIINQASATDPNKRVRGFVQGKNIKWFANSEICDMYGSTNDGPGDGSFLEFDRPTTSRPATSSVITGWHQQCLQTPDPDPQVPQCWDVPEYSVTTEDANYNPWRLTLPGRGVGAFAVTAEDGTTYHYSLPVYHYVEYSRSREKNAPQGAQKPGVATQTIGTIAVAPYKGGYATTWLLTAITSSDYIDRGGADGVGNGTVDPSDWGGWVRFEYGKFSDHYKWRQPYLGEDPTENDANNATYAEGLKETYYLNAIRTRTHTALFVKSVRNDGRGHFQTAAMRQAYGRHLGQQELQPASSLRLDEIVLLNNEDYARLQTPDGTQGATDTGGVIPAFTTDTNGNASQFQSELGSSSGDSYSQVIDSHDIDSDARIRNFINLRALKRVKFNYSYRLCANTPNSFAAVSPLPPMEGEDLSCSRTGKLTLESLSIYGPANTKLAPDYLFHYGNNPDYYHQAWDGFGMYKSGPSVASNHGTNPDYSIASTDGAAWSLTEIVSPLGGKTKIQYERDQYGSVSEFGNQDYLLSDQGTSAPNGTFVGSGTVDLTKMFKPGDVVYLDGHFTSVYNVRESRTDGNGDNSFPHDCQEPFASDVTLTGVTPNSITIANPPSAPLPNDNCIPANGNGYTYSGWYDSYKSLNVNLKVNQNKNGGDLRVASLAVEDESGHSYQTQYQYTNYFGQGVNSTGVIAKEPAYVNTKKRPFDVWYDYPATSVIYGKTTVFQGGFRNSQDYDAREEYTFNTPATSMIRVASSAVRYGRMSDAIGMETRSHVTTVDLGKIGQPIAIRKFNRRGELEVSSTFEYANAVPNPDGLPGQGIYTEGVMTNDLLDSYVYRINRSTTRYLPTILTGTTSKATGLTTHAQSDKFDFYTGKVLESSFRNYLGEEYSSRIIPAYSLPNFAAMGPSSLNPSYRNMLAQDAAAYTYKKRAGGGRSVLVANIQTWNGSWNTYRSYNAATDSYEDRADDPRQIWRLHESYVWSSPRLNGDGTYADADFSDFDWTRSPLSGQAAGWVKAGEYTRYDHFSKPLESRDVNGQYVTRKLNAGQHEQLITAANARYTEVAYSGAEDATNPLSANAHFGGEVRDASRRSSDYSHTGSYSSKLLPGQVGFTYKAAIGTEVRGGRKYRLSCWVHNSDVARGGQLYAKLDGTDLGSATINSPNTKKAGAWYLLNLLVDVPTTGQQLVVGCRNAGTQPVYADDFRFQPVEGPATAYVYSSHTGQMTHVLDNENLYTRMEYNAAGQLTRTYKEVLTPANTTSASAERLVKERVYNYARTREPNWLPTGILTWSPGLRGQVLPRQREEKDINPLSPSFNTTRMVADGSSPSCTTACPPADTFLRTECGSTEDAGGNQTCFTIEVRADGNCGESRSEPIYNVNCPCN